jgi:general stress protein CsbA
VNVLIVAGILFSHIMAARPFVINLQKGRMPNTAHFAAVSFVLYYDMGLLLEVTGLYMGNEFFTPFFNSDPWVMFLEIIIITVGPWLFHLGSSFTSRENGWDTSKSYAQLRKSTKPLFYFVIIAIASYFAFNGLSEMMTNDPIWVVRERLGERWGPLIVLLYLPLHFLAFYSRQSDSTTKMGLLMSWGLVLATILSTLGIGQRTNMLLPMLIMVLFRKKISAKKIVTFLIVAIIAASVLLPFFKWQKADSQDITSAASIGVLVAETIETDFYRGDVLSTIVEKTELLGTKTMPYPLAGYIYTILYYIPRNLVPFKGASTSQTFTAEVVRTPIDDTFWAFGVGVLEEAMLNVGFIFAVPILIVYGMGMGLLDKVSARVPSILIPTRLACIWICGYESSTVLLMFGTMALVGFILHKLFVKEPTKQWL